MTKETEKAMSHIEHIRLRPSMYIGRIGDGSYLYDGVYFIFKKIIDISIKEYLKGYGEKINVNIDENKITIRNFSQDYSYEDMFEHYSIHKDEYTNFAEVVTNALSEKFIVNSYHNKRFKRIIFEYGILQHEESGNTTEANGTQIEFTLDDQIFKGLKIKNEYIDYILWQYAPFHRGLSLHNGEKTYYAPNGLLDFLKTKTNNNAIVHYRDDFVEFAFAYTTKVENTFFPFVNGVETRYGGTHLIAFKKALKDFRKGKKVVGAINVKLSNPFFSDTINACLTNREVINPIKDKIIKILAK